MYLTEGHWNVIEETVLQGYHSFMGPGFEKFIFLCRLKLSESSEDSVLYLVAFGFYAGLQSKDYAQV